MTSGDDAERSGEERAFAEPDGGSAEEADGGEDTAVDPVPVAGVEEPRPRRRKAGVEYRPV